MSSKNPIEQLKREGSVALWHDYRLGHANDLSGNGNDGTLVNDPWFDRNGINTTYLGNEAVQVNHSASINLTTFTVVALIVTKRVTRVGASNLPQLARKEGGGGGLSWSIRLDDNVGRVSVDAAGSIFWGLTRPHASGVRCYGVTMATGVQASPVYLDGVLDVASSNATPTYNTTNAALYIANRSALDRGIGRSLSSFIMFNKVLSATEHAQVYGQLMKTRRGIIS